MIAGVDIEISFLLKICRDVLIFIVVDHRAVENSTHIPDLWVKSMYRPMGTTLETMSLSEPLFLKGGMSERMEMPAYETMQTWRQETFL